MTGLRMASAAELVAAGFERARVARLVRGQADAARRFVAAGRIDAATGAMFARWCDALAEMVERGLWDDAVDIDALMPPEGAA